MTTGSFKAGRRPPQGTTAAETRAIRAGQRDEGTSVAHLLDDGDPPELLEDLGEPPRGTADHPGL